MKPALLVPVFLLVVGLSAASLYYAQRRKDASHVSANAVVELAADAQRDIARAPMQFTRISDREEIAIGERLSSQYVSLMQPSSGEQRALEFYVQHVGASIASHAHRSLRYEFHLVPDRYLINAFSLPGGPVYVGQGITELMQSEDELAGVLAHEIEHIDHYHCVERFQLEAKLRHLRLGAMSELFQLPLSLWEAGYHKDEELEADREGMLLAVKAGYSPYGSVKMFERFAKLEDEYVIHARTPQEELSQLAIESLGGYFRTHPQPSERIEQADRIIAEQHWEARTELKPFRIEYEVHNGKLVKP